MHSTTTTVQSDGASLRLRQADVDGEQALLVHGGPGGIDYLFKFFVRPLHRLGYRAASFVQRGSPGSPSDGPFRIESFIDDIEAIREHLSVERFTLIGHSWGGLLSAFYAAQYPHYVSRLVLICPMGPRAGYQEKFAREIESRMSPQDLRTYRQLKRDAEHASSKADWQRILTERTNIAIKYYYSFQHRKDQPGVAHINHTVRSSIHNQLEEWYGNPAWEKGLEKMSAPAAVLYGTEDPIPPSVAEDYREILSNPIIIPLHGIGHFPWFEDKDDFFEAFELAMRHE